MKKQLLALLTVLILLFAVSAGADSRRKAG